MRRPELTHSQRWGGAILFVLMVVVLAVLQTHPVPEQETEQWRRDSIRHHWDSIYSHDDSLKRHWHVYYDSLFHRRDSLRQYWDSINATKSSHTYRDTTRGVRDSLGQADSLYIPRYVKRDTIIELNSADTASLCLIRGVGSYAARKILRYRYELGGYYSPDQIREIEELERRFSSERFDTIISHLTACPDSIRRIPVNRSAIRMMARHPYIRYSAAEAIYDYRRRHIRIRDIDELRTLNCFTDEELKVVSYYLSFE